MNKIRFSLCQPIKRFVHTKRKYPLDPTHTNEVPIFKYAASSHKRNRVYAWGNAKIGALGLPYRKAKENKHQIQYYQCPKRLHFGEINMITSVATGFGYSLFTVDTDEGAKLYGTGLNTDSQIGYHEIRQNKPLSMIFFAQPIHIPLLDVENSKIFKASAGRAHSAVLTNSGLYLFGNNSYGQCGRVVVENERYAGSKFIHNIKQIDGKDIVDVECGQDHTLVILADGSVYSCGWGADGQTGLGHYNCVADFTKVCGDIANEKIVKLSSRSDFVLALNDNSEVFGWGNTEYRQITMPDGSQQVATPTHIKMLGSLGKIRDVAAGGSFCLVVDENGHVFVWGFGLLGTGPQVQESFEPRPIPPQMFGYNDFSPESQVKSVSCGLGHMAAVTNKGDLYMWGRNRDSCLGLGHTKDQYFPLKVAIGAFVEQISCGLDHTIAICKTYLAE